MGLGLAASADNFLALAGNVLRFLLICGVAFVMGRERSISVWYLLAWSVLLGSVATVRGGL